MAGTGPGHVTAPAAALAGQLPGWVALFRAPNPGPMTLDGTNTWVLRSERGAPALVIDPGPLDEGHLRAVADAGPVGTVLITHGHPDHTEGLERFVALTGAEVLDAGGELAGGSGGSGGTGGSADGIDRYGLRVRRIATPGHTGDSVCFEVGDGAGGSALFTGDTILGRGTTVVAWPDGDLGDYLDSLRLLSAYPEIPALPGHGPALADCAGAARTYLVHRQARLDQVRAVVAAGIDAPAEVVRRVYGDLDPALRTAAEWSARAQLAYLRRESHPAPAPLDQP